MKQKENKNQSESSVLAALKQPLHQAPRQHAGDAAPVMAGRKSRLHRHDLIAHEGIEAIEHSRIEWAAA